MPSHTETFVATPLDAVFEYPIGPGVLVSLTVSINSLTILPGDAYVAASIHEQTIAESRPLIELVNGHVVRYRPLVWSGQFSLEQTEILAIRYNGITNGTMTTYFHILKSTYLKEIGEYQRATNR